MKSGSLAWLMRILKFAGFVAVASVFLYLLLGVLFLLPPNVAVVPSPFEHPSVETGEGAFNATLPVLVVNAGFSPINDVLIRFRMVDDSGRPLIEVPRVAALIPAKSIIPLRISFYVDFSGATEDVIERFINSSLYFQYEALVTLRYLHSRIGFLGAVRIPLKIGSPLYNFTITEVSVISPTQVNVSFSFTNKFQPYQLEFTSYVLNSTRDKVTSDAPYSKNVPLGSFNETITYTLTSPPLPPGTYTVVFNFTKPFVFSLTHEFSI